MNDDWDLHAVVRGCAGASSAATTTAATILSADSHQNSFLSSFTTQKQSFHGDTVFGELPDLYRPFLHELNPSISTSSSSSSVAFLNPQQQRGEEQKQNKRLFSVSVSPSTSTNKAALSSTSRSKRRKIQQKRVCHVPAEALNSDVWAWRKYGQKPIKGSPFPRGYYKCSTSKGCLARKQVERNKSDPTMFIITYTAEHNHSAPTHRNSLAGSTRQKPSDQPQTVSGACESTLSPATTTNTTCSAAGATCSSSSLATSAENLVLPAVEDLAVDDLEGYGDLLSMSDTVVSDDFFEGLEGFAGDSFSGDSLACFGLPWLANNAAVTADGF